MEQQIDEAIRNLKAKGATVREIENTLGIGWERYKKVTNSPPGSKLIHKRGKRTKITNEMREYIDQISLLDGTLSDQKVADAVNEKFGQNISRSYIYKIRNKLGFRYRPPYTVQHLTEE